MGVEAAFGLSVASTEPLGGDFHRTEGLVTSDGRRYVLKRAGDRSDLEEQARILGHLERRLEVAVPTVVPPAVAPDGGTWIQLHTWVDGVAVGALRRRSPTLLHDWGALAARMVAALEGLDVARQGHRWDLRSAGADEALLASLVELPEAVVHHDLNDANVLAAPDRHGVHRVVGVIDVGDVSRAPAVVELGVATAYALRHRERPLAALGALVRGWASVRPLTDHEAALVFPIACLRLRHVARTWGERLSEGSYAASRLAGTEHALARLDELHPAVAEAAVRRAAGLPDRPVHPGVARFARVLGPHGAPAAPPARRRSDDAEPEMARLGVVVDADLEPGVRDEGGWWSRTRQVDGGSQLQVWTATPNPGAPWAVRPSELDVWSTVCVDPLHEGQPLDVVALRSAHVARSQRAYYDRPMVLERAEGMWFEDRDGLRYLDAVNNVTHLGHGQPDVVAAGARQMARLNTNSRFVYPQLAEYAERLTGTLPEGLDVVFFCCTGSEANDLALRIARTVTGRNDVVVIGGAYHGNTVAVTGISPNRYRGPGGTGPPPTTHETDQPDRYRGRHRGEGAGERYTADAVALVRSLVAAGRPPGACFAESLQGTGGQIVLPPGYLAALFAEVRAAGGLCVSDEVQVGFGRLGSTFWGFAGHDVVPDIVTMGKPMGNGHPMSAVVTTREIADAFDNGMRYFNTFGGNPVSCAIGTAVLDVLERDRLQESAAHVGGHLLERLRVMMDRHPLVGDVRGQGLYIGVELVRDRASLEPADVEARIVAERMKEEGVITYPNGTFENVLKLKPPMVATQDDADLTADTLDEVLADGW